MERPGRSELNAFEKWKHSYSGRVAWIILAVTIMYIFGSMAIDSGILWQWGLAGLFAIDAVYNAVRLIGKIYGRKPKAGKA